jgi:glycosyltransferase involved in cell wall biosynthesis
MKVLHVISGLSRGGAEAALCRLIAGSSDIQHEVLVLTHNKEMDDQIRAAGASVHYIDLKAFFALPARLFSTVKFIRRSRPDVLQTWMYHADVIGGLLARIVGIRAIAWGVHHACPDAPDLGRGARLFAWLGMQLSSWVPSEIVACSVTSRICHVRYGYSSDKVRVIKNGYDTQRFSVQNQSRDVLRKQWGVSNDVPLLGTVARYHPVKGHQFLLAALAQIKAAGGTFKCALVGDGVEGSNLSLRALIDRFGLNDDVLLLGPRTDIPDVMNALDILVLCSLAEAFPNVLSEAMACGTPCVTTDVGDAADIVGQTGWLVPPGQVTSLANAITDAISARTHVKSWQLRCQSARERIVGNFSLSRMVDAYVSCWRRLIAKTAGGDHAQRL